MAEKQQNKNVEDWLEEWRESQIGTACIWLFYTIFLAIFIYGVVIPFFGIMIGLYAIGFMFCWPCCCGYYFFVKPNLTKQPRLIKKSE